MPTLTADQSRTLSNIVKKFKDITSIHNHCYDRNKEAECRRMLIVFFRDELAYPLEELEGPHVVGLAAIYGPSSCSLFDFVENCISQTMKEFAATWCSRAGANSPEFQHTLRIKWDEDGICYLIDFSQAKW